MALRSNLVCVRAGLFNHFSLLACVGSPREGLGYSLQSPFTLSGGFSACNTRARARKIKVLGHGYAAANPRLPSVPAISKAGIASLARFEAGGWFGIFIPSSTPEALQQRLAQDIRSVLEQRDTREAIARTGTDPRILMRAEFAAYLQSELERWTPVIRSRNIKPD